MKKLLSLLLFIGLVFCVSAQQKAIVSKTTEGDSIVIGANTVYAILGVGSNSKVLNTLNFKNPIYLDKSLTEIYNQSPESWLRFTVAVTKKPYYVGREILINRKEIVSIMNYMDGKLYVNTVNPQYDVIVDGSILYLIQCYIDVVDGL